MSIGTYNLPKPTDFFDDPKVLNAATVNIPGSGSDPVQVIASLAVDADEVEVPFDQITRPIGIYAYNTQTSAWDYKGVFGGQGRPALAGRIVAGSRIGLRHMESSAITSGKVMALFHGRYASP